MTDREMTNREKQDNILRAELNAETAQMAWKELLRFFAAGTVIFIGKELDLVDVALHMSRDDKDVIAQWLEQGGIAKVTDQQAKAWLEADLMLWTVVVRPWILVQPEKAA
jgi:hypothetical protein